MLKRILLLIFMMFMVIPLVQAQEQNERLALETVARINEWRIEQGTWPLRLNPILTDMAISHASYLVSLDDLPDNLHAGPTGLNPRERALLDPFDWPHYQLPEQIAVGENAGIGTLDFAMTFWEKSDIHRSTSLNPVYREIGVAALPYNDGHLFIVVFGGRPNVLPALLDPRDGQTIYLSNEVYEYAPFFDSVQGVVELQMFDADGQPLFSEPQPWSPELTIPEGAGDTVYLLMSDGEKEVLSRINRETDSVITMESLLEPEAEPVVDEPTATPEPPQDDVTDAEEEPTDEATPEPTIEPTPEPVINQPEILITYSTDTMNILNVSGDVADWQTLELQGVVSVPFTQFTRVMDLDLSAIPDRHCVQIRSTSVSGDVVLPESCRWMRSLVTVQADRLIWRVGDFEVFRNGASIASCSASESVCEVDFD